jgi:methionyl aminopeptidase
MPARYGCHLDRIFVEAQVGQTFTIEPILHAGRTGQRIWRDGWTAITRDGSISAQFEHTVLITENGAEILTAYE